MTPKNESVRDPQELYRAGIALMRRGRGREALGILQQARDLAPRESRYLSQYGLCLAVAAGRAREGVKLCRQAVEQEFYRPELYCNLGRALLAAGRRSEAQDAFREGLTLEPQHRMIIRELEKMGIRRKPLFPFLNRGNPLNRWPGMMRQRLGGRSRTAA